MGVSTTENLLLVGAGSLVVGAVFFIMMNFVFAIKPPNLKAKIVALYSNPPSVFVEPVAGAAPDLSLLWVALLVIALFVCFVGARLVFESYAKGAA